jgi:hypothetical protein
MLRARELKHTREAGDKLTANSVLRNSIQDEIPGEGRYRIKEMELADKL